MNLEEWKQFTFGQPWWLLGLIALPILAWLQGGRRPAPAVRFSAVAPLRAVGKAKPSGWGGFGRPLLFVALALLITALARPRLGKSFDTIESSGVDIILTLDVSGSMSYDDFSLDGAPASRLEAVKLVARRFIESRPTDRIGMVVFAQVPFLLSPATLDHQWLLKNLERLYPEMLGRGGTYIAAAIGNAANRLDDNKAAKSKIIILLTDGAQNTGTEDPVEAAQAANKLGIKLYTIGAGSDRSRDGSVFSFMPGAPRFTPADEESLRKTAAAGGGQFFRATDTASLVKIFEQIDQLEKTEVKMKRKVEWRELFEWFIAAGCALLALRTTLALTLWRTVP
jgi:Ca-activated chloride channel family protein